MNQPLPAYRGNETYIFICYAHQDKDLVYPQIRWLQDEDFNVWYDDGISPGEDWSEELGQAIERADRLLFFVSPASVASRHCRDEIHFAKNHETQLLAIHLEATGLPAGIELALGASQAIMAYQLSGAAYQSKVRETLQVENSTSAKADTPGVPKPRLAPRITSTLVALLVIAALAAWLTVREPSRQPTFDRSISILALKPNAPNDEIDSYSMGLTQEFRDKIAGYPELRTLIDPDLRTGTRQASYLLLGDVQRIGGSRRVRTQLVRTSDHIAVWTETFDDPINVVSDPSALAATIGRFLRLQLFRDHQCELVNRTDTGGTLLVSRNLLLSKLRPTDVTSGIC